MVHSQARGRAAVRAADQEGLRAPDPAPTGRVTLDMALPTGIPHCKTEAKRTGEGVCTGVRCCPCYKILPSGGGQEGPPSIPAACSADNEGDF